MQAKVISHHRFGTATVYLPCGLKVDITTARRETYPYPARLPVVEPGPLRDDLFRRDFTINAMAIQISGKEYGQLIDLFDGNNDLKKGLLRVLHPASFIDDPTRILRGIRFEQRFDFKFEPGTLRLLHAAVKRSMLQRVEPQRLRDELILILKESSAVKAIRRVAALAGLSFISPKLKVTAEMMHTLSQIEQRLKLFASQAACARPLDEWLIYFMGLLGGLPIPDIRAVCRRFVFRKADEKRIISCAQMCNRVLSALGEKKLTRSGVFHILEPLSYEEIVLILSRTDKKIIIERIMEFLKFSHETKISISGHDLKGYGLKPGPHYRHILTAVLNAKVDGQLKDKASELRLAREMAQQMNGRHINGKGKKACVVKNASSRR